MGTEVIKSNDEKLKPIALNEARRIYDQFFSQLSRLDEKDIICRPNCKFCNHPKRFEAEELWEQNRSLIRIKKFFEEYEAQQAEDEEIAPMSITNIRTHLYNHYAEQQKRLRLKEYCERLPALIDSQLNQDRLFDMLLATMSEKYLDLASDNSVDKFKQCDAMTKMAGQALKIIELQARLRGELRTVNVMAEKFLNVWVNAIQSEKDMAVKQKLIESLDIFKEQIGEFSLTNE